MNHQTRIYTDDRLVHYRNSNVPPETTKIYIEALLREYGLKNVRWEGTSVLFDIEGAVNEKPANFTVRLDCPQIYDRATERVNESVSMRTLYWWIKSHLEVQYLRQSSPLMTFVENVETPQGRMKDILPTQIMQHGLAVGEKCQFCGHALRISQGKCANCGAPIQIKPMQPIKRQRTIICRNCHNTIIPRPDGLCPKCGKRV